VYPKGRKIFQTVFPSLPYHLVQILSGYAKKFYLHNVFHKIGTTSPESKFPNEYTDVIFIQIDQHLEKLLPKYNKVPIL